MRLRNFQCIFALVAVVIGASFASEHFFTLSNLCDILRFASVAGVLAVGQTLVILTAGIDLSVGSLLALTNVVAAGAMVWGKVPIPVACAICISVGALSGLVNGLLITHGKLQPFVATLAMMMVARGAAQAYSQNRPITGLPESFSWFNGSVGGAVPILRELPIPGVIFMLVVVAAWLLLSKTALGRQIFAIGGNQEAARLSGIRVNLVKLFAYGFCGATAAIGALLHTAKINVGHPAEGMGFELDAIAAVVLGGTDLMGGRGSVLWTFAGALTLQVITNILLLNNIHPAVAKMIKGGIIVAAILLGRLIDVIETRVAQRRAVA